jgi:hypothetical protein
MELANFIKRFAYRVEPKPEGGFMARSPDPTVPSLEAPTREELQQKIRANLLAALKERFPGMKLPLPNQQLNPGVQYEVHVERKPGGGFAVHSEDASGKEPAGQEKFDHMAEGLLDFVDKHFPQISEAIATEAGSRDLKVFVDKKTGSSVSASAAFDWKMLAPTSPMPSDGTTLEGAVVEATTTETLSPNAAVPDLSHAVFSNAPITPEAGGNWKLFRFLLALLILGVIVYFVLHRG